MKRARTVTAAAVLLALLGPLEATAQVRVVPRAGVYAPATGWGRVSTVDGVRDLERRRPSLALGGAVEIGPTDRTSVRLNALYGTTGEIPVTGSGCEAGACRGRSSLLTLTGSVALRPLRAGALAQPYLLMGGGFERREHDFGEADALGRALRDGAGLAGQVGIGVEWTLGILRGVVELSDLVGGPVVGPGGEGGVQHDLFVTLGVTLG